MVTVTVIATPNDEDAPDSVPRRVFEAAPDVEIEVEGIVPLDGDSAIPYVWVWGEELAPFERALDVDEQVSAATLLERVEGGALYRVEWEVDSPVLHCIEQAGGALMEAYGTAEQWMLTVWFEEGSDASTFLQCCTTRDVTVEVDRYHPTAAEAGDGSTVVTPSQREALLVAYENGYFEQPRAITQQELADRLGISAAAAGNRLRRGTANMIERTLLE